MAEGGSFIHTPTAQTAVILPFRDAAINTTREDDYFTPEEVFDFAQNHPFLEGGVRKSGGLYCAFNGAHLEKLFLLTVGQIEHVLWILAERKAQVHPVVLQGYALPGCIGLFKRM